jgi:RimJ/RimL family protein N-acetyltransferase
LIQNFLGFAFREYGLQRISMEIPEHYPKLIRFARQKLGFSYESELDLERYERFKPRLKDQSDSMRIALSLHGSRREGSHWNPKTESWEDVILLRLLRREYEQSLASPGLEPNATSEPSIQESSGHEFRLQERPV